MKLLKIGLAILACFPALEAQRPGRAYGLIRASEDAYLNYRVAALPPTGILPAAASLERYLPPPGYQGTTQGSCTAWATTFALRTALQAKLNNTWQPLNVVQRQFSPAFVFNKAKADSGIFDCSRGIFFATALTILQTTGTPTLESFPYDPNRCDVRPTPSQVQQAGRFLIAGWERTSDLTNNRFKAHLAAGDPVLVGIDIYPSFDDAQGLATITGNTGEWRGYHAVVLIGYDDAKKAFRLQNSWGPIWGDQGRAWIDYDTLKNIVREAYRVTPLLPSSSFELPAVSSLPSSPRIQRFGIVNDSSQPDFARRMRDLVVSLGGKASDVSSDKGRLAVKVNTFGSKDQALMAARNIVQGPTGLDAKVLPQVVQGKTVYSVVVAADLSSVEASIVISKAKRAGFGLATTIGLK